MRRVPRTARVGHAISPRTLAALPTNTTRLTPALPVGPRPLTAQLQRLSVRRRPQLVAALDPDLLELSLNLRAARRPLFDLGEPVAQLGELLFDRRLLRRGADARKLPLFARVAQAQGEQVRVVALEGGAGGDCDESWRVRLTIARWMGVGWNLLIPFALQRSYSRPSTSEETAEVPSSTNA